MAEVTERRRDLLEKQNGACAVCGTSDPGSRGWQLDHDHRCCAPRLIGKRWRSDTVNSCGECDRGALCFVCNTKVVGWLEKYFVLAPRALEYVLGSPLTETERGVLMGLVKKLHDRVP